MIFIYLFWGILAFAWSVASVLLLFSKAITSVFEPDLTFWAYGMVAVLALCSLSGTVMAFSRRIQEHTSKEAYFLTLKFWMECFFTGVLLLPTSLCVVYLFFVIFLDSSWMSESLFFSGALSASLIWLVLLGLAAHEKPQ